MLISFGQTFFYFCLNCVVENHTWISQLGSEMPVSSSEKIRM
jgi:hypothetical protein